MTVVSREFSCLALFAVCTVLKVAQGQEVTSESSVSLAPLPSTPAWMQPDPSPLRRHASCECSANVCGCCAKFHVQKLLFRQQGCLNLTYEPSELTLTMDLLLSNSSIFQASLSGRNPPPLCVPVPQLPIISICVKLHSLQTVGQDFKACLDLELRLQGITLLVFSFDCLLFGPGGLTVVKPTKNQTDPTVHVGQALSNLLAAITTGNKVMQHKLLPNTSENLIFKEDTKLNQLNFQNVTVEQSQIIKTNSSQIPETLDGGMNDTTTVASTEDFEQGTEKVESTTVTVAEQPTNSTDNETA